MDYYQKYLKYKTKYLELKAQLGGVGGKCDMCKEYNNNKCPKLRCTMCKDNNKKTDCNTCKKEKCSKVCSKFIVPPNSTYTVKEYIKNSGSEENAKCGEYGCNHSYSAHR